MNHIFYVGDVIKVINWGYVGYNKKVGRHIRDTKKDAA